jgi:2',3'-cyclic-nucleotide 2'-phosphodiesterase (5'-nucleotidase family)
VRDSQESVWLFDGGDVFGNAKAISSLDDKLMGETLLKGLDLCGYDAMTLGEEDFRFGETLLAERIAETAMAVTSANVVRRSDQLPYASPFFTKTVGETTVGVIGVLSEDDEAQVEAASSIDGVAVTLEPALSAISAARAAMGEVDLTVVLAHMPTAAAKELAAELTEIQVVVAAHDHAAPAAEQVGNLAFVAAGYDGKWMANLGLVLNPQGTLSKATFEAVELDDRWEDDPELAALYQDYLERLETEAATIVQSIPQQTPAGGSYVGSAQCISCHPDQATAWATTKHANAFATLVETNHDYSPSCFPCHTVGFGFIGGFLLPNMTPGVANVQCESCHGAGADHVALPALGFAPPAVTQCTKCHTPENSPQFDMVTYLPQVQH